MKTRQTSLFSVLATCFFLLSGCSCGSDDNNNYGGGDSYIQAPGNLRVTSFSSTHISLSWEDNSDNEEGFRIERRQSDNDYTETGQTHAGATSYPSLGLSLDTLYYYRICAYNSSGCSEYSNEVSATTSNSLDKWGGDSRIKNPYSKHQTGTATSITQWTLTDTSKNWKPDELIGYILQPYIDIGNEYNQDAEIYFLIKSNTNDTITVYGSDATGDEEFSHKYIPEFNNGSQTYAILDRWSVQKVNQRWLLFDPYGNGFFIKSINGFNGEYHRYGNDHDGNSFEDNLCNKYSTSDRYEAAQMEIDIVKQMGFNCWGEVVDVARIAPGGYGNAAGKIPSRYSPFIGHVRIGSLDLENVDRFDMFGLGTGTYVWDAYDPDFKDEIKEHLLIDSGSRADGFTAFGGIYRTDYWHEWYLTPYRSHKFNMPANPYYIGIDWDEEPRYLRGESTTDHIGYYILVQPYSMLCKQEAISYLQSQYSSINDLNTSWGSSFSTWTDLENAGSAEIDSLLNIFDYNNDPLHRYWDYEPYNETNTNLKADMDVIAERFWREYCKKVHDAFDELTSVHMLNFGPGYHGWQGMYQSNFAGCASPEYLFRGSVSEDGLEPYIDIIGIGDPTHSPHSSVNDDTLEFMRDDLKEFYNFHGRPYWHESCWVTAETDSGITYTGTIDSLQSTILYDSSYNFQTANAWDSAMSCGRNMGLWIIPDISIPQDQRIYYRIASTGAANGNLTVDVAQGQGNGWSWSTSPDMTQSGSVGTTYGLVFNDMIPNIGGHGDPYNLFIPLTQEERATMYVKFLDDLINFQADNGDYIDVGYSHWEFYDYGFREGSFHEMRNWGFETVKCNLYDGIQATTSNGEMQDCGNFVGPVSEKLNIIYNDITQMSGK